MTELTLLCVHPHPDDEAIACGGVLARTVAQGRDAHVVTCTGGEVGENQSGIDLGDEDMATHRRREMADAAAALGLTSHRWLGYRDSGMVDTEDNDHPDAFVQADLEEAAGRLASIIRELRPRVVVCDDELGTYGHPDHIMAHRVTARAVIIAADPGWNDGQEGWQVDRVYVHTLSRSRMWQMHELLMSAGLESPFGDADELDSPDDLPFGSDDALISVSVDVGDQLAIKQAAMRAHRSQIGEDSFFLNFPPELQRAGFSVEEFIRVDAPSTGPIAGDLFDGLAA